MFGQGAWGSVATRLTSRRCSVPKIGGYFILLVHRKPPQESPSLSLTNHALAAWQWWLFVPACYSWALWLQSAGRLRWSGSLVCSLPLASFICSWVRFVVSERSAFRRSGLRTNSCVPVRFAPLRYALLRFAPERSAPERSGLLEG
jgi:hypothetical protein